MLTMEYCRLGLATSGRDQILGIEEKVEQNNYSSRYRKLNSSNKRQTWKVRKGSR